MPPKKRTFNDYTSNPNAPTKKNAAKKRGWGKKGERTLSTPYTKEDFVKEWVIDQDDPLDVMLTMSGVGWMAKALIYWLYLPFSLFVLFLQNL